MAEKMSATPYPRLKRSSTVSTASTASVHCSSVEVSDEASRHENLLVCLLCCSHFVQPKILECQHIFCEACLLEYASSSAATAPTSIHCPTCYQVTELPTGISQLKSGSEDNPRKISVISEGVGALQRCDVCIYKRHVEEALFLCRKCGLNLCATCHDLHEQQTVFLKHNCVAVGSKKNVLMLCESHYKMQAAWWCLECQGSPVCSVCILLKHPGHKVDKLENVLGQKRDQVKAQLRKLGPLLDRVQEALDVKCVQTKGKLRTKQASLEKRSSVVEPPMIVVTDAPGISVQRLISYNRMFNMTLNMLEANQSKRLILLFDNIMPRLECIISKELVDVPEIGRGGGNGRDGIGGTESGQEDTISAAAAATPLPQLLHTPKLIWKIEKQTRDPVELWNPCAVTFLPDGCTIVAEYDIINDKNNKLRVFSADGKPVSTIGQGNIRPLGVTFSKDGMIYATDCETKRVKIFSICGTVVGEIGKGQFGWPYGVAVNSKGQVIVSDAFRDSISIFGGDGKRTKLIGLSTNPKEQLRSPFHVTVDAKDNIYVADSGNHKIKVFDADGCYLRASSSTSSYSSPKSHFDVTGARAGSEARRKRMKCPRGVAVDMLGNLLVTDDSSVAIFNSSCVYQQNVLGYKDGVKFPEAVAANNEGQLAVTEWNPNNMFAVKVYNMFG